MRFYVITVLPELFDSFLRTGLVAKAIKAGAIEVQTITPREFARDRHRTVDDAPYGGGSGMVMMAGPLCDAMEAAEAREAAREGGWRKPLRILLTPQGEPFTQATARAFAAERRPLTLVCGRYEGVDERARARCDREISLGDFVLMGGEIGAMAIVESVARLLPGVLGNPQSLAEESHAAGRLEYPQYTRPASFRGEMVPEILLSGHHAQVARWRRKKSLERTLDRRPDLFEAFPPDEEERAILDEIRAERARERGQQGERERGAETRASIDCALVHYPVCDRDGSAITSAITNVNVHDLARSARTYGLRGYWVVSPIAAQRVLVDRILEHWRTGAGRRRVPERSRALAIARPIESVEAVVAAIAEREGRAPRVWATAARGPEGRAVLGWEAARAALADPSAPPTLLLWGTAHGLHPDLIARADALLAPIDPGTGFNHLSVRAAAAITLDRLLGRSPPAA
jgi:tRNA (guanine37-N1)-methyltransferase